MKKFRSYVLLAALTVVMSVMFSSCIQFESERTLEIHNYSDKIISSVYMADSSSGKDYIFPKIIYPGRTGELNFYGSGEFTVYLEITGDKSYDVRGYVNVPKDPKITARIILAKRTKADDSVEYYIEDRT